MLYGVGTEERHATLLTGVQPYTGQEQRDPLVYANL